MIPVNTPSAQSVRQSRSYYFHYQLEQQLPSVTTLQTAKALTSQMEASSSSEGSYSNRTTLHSDEEVILASARPKKRAGRRIFKETRHPVYRGVRRRNKNKWVCEVRVPNNKSRIWLGTYPTAEMAARAHDVAALALRGKSACINFEDSAWRLPLPTSTDAEEIRRVASQAAEAFGDEKVLLQSSGKATNDYEVCCSSSVEVMGNANPVQEEGIDLDEVPAVAEFDDLQGLLSSLADEPLRSPPPLVRDGRDWNDMDVDPEVSLWSFNI